MAYKLSFKINRTRYTGNAEDINRQINQELVSVANSQRIELLHIYQPSRDSIKVIFPDEKNVNKAMTKSAALKSAGFEPRLSMALKAARTVYCFNLDDTLLNTYTQQDIKESLQQAEWKVKDVYIMNSKKTFKIEMETTQEARKFINNKRTAVGNILIHQESKEMEVDPTIPQCWECGQLNPKHISSTCPGNKRCIKCGNRSHQFFSCPMPKDIDRMTERDKENRYCIPCDARGNHTSLDHRQCPEKRRLVQEKIKTARDKRKAEEIEDRRDTNLIQKTLEIVNTNAWPALQNSKEQQKTASIILLALLDENTNQGSFQNNLDKGLKENGLPTIKYSPSPGTASLVANLLTGTSNDNLSNYNTPQNTSHNTPQDTSHGTTRIIAQNTLQNTSQNKATSKHKKKPNLQAKIDGGIFNIIQRKDTEKLKEPSAAASYNGHTPTTIGNLEILSTTESEPSLLRKLSGEEHNDYYRLNSAMRLDSSEETSSDHASPTMDIQNQITCPQSFTTNNTIVETVTISREDNDSS